jgi:cystathionine beta-lyase/cystathionine gamma-synthase
VKTLAIRMDRSASNAHALAEYLQQHPQVERVIYPGLRSHPQYEVAKRQMTSGGAMITIFSRDRASLLARRESGRGRKPD